MSSNTPAIAALIFVPIVIAASAASIALKTTEFYKCIARFCRKVWDKWSPVPVWKRRSYRRHKQRRSDLSSTEVYGDSWCDLQSIHSNQPVSTFINQSTIRKEILSHGNPSFAGDNEHGHDTPSRIWHPARSARLAWSFANPRSNSPNRFELSSVVRPSPVARPSERLSAEDAESLVAQTRAEVRNGRGSILNGSFEDGPLQAGSTSAISELIKKNAERNALQDPELTPKASKHVTGTTTAGAFLKSEFHSVRGYRGFNNAAEYIPMSRLDHENTSDSPAKFPERRLSKSKNFFLKTLGSRRDQEPKSIQRIGSSASQNTLFRRLSRSGNHSTGSYSTYVDSITSTSTGYSFEPTSQDIADVSINSRITSYGDRDTCSPSSTSKSAGSSTTGDILVLSPQITITPETSSIECGSANLWVAVEVTGILRRADGHESEHHKVGRCPSQSMSTQFSDLRRYGRLDSMRIDLVTGRDSTILETIGDLHELKAIRASETHFILVKLRLARVTKSTSHTRESSTSDELIADLENHLDDILTSYLTVRLSYKHSGFLSQKNTALISDADTSVHKTKLQTEVTSFIKRHNIQSAWSPRNSRNLNGQLEVNPIMKLIETHFSADKAREAIHKLTDERFQIPVARRVGRGSETAGGSSEETVKARNRSGHVPRIDSAVSLKIIRAPDRIATSSSVAELKSKEPEPTTPEIDPARKIWTEMRRTSRGDHHHRSSISAGHYHDDSDDCSPGRLSRLCSGGMLDEERNLIRQMALKNKRSVGADTLRSIAPSLGKAKGGSMGAGGLGLGVGRSWGWGGSWW